MSAGLLNSSKKHYKLITSAEYEEENVACQRVLDITSSILPTAKSWQKTHNKKFNLEVSDCAEFSSILFLNVSSIECKRKSILFLLQSMDDRDQLDQYYDVLSASSLTMLINTVHCGSVVWSRIWARLVLSFPCNQSPMGMIVLAARGYQ